MEAAPPVRSTARTLLGSGLFVGVATVAANALNAGFQIALARILTPAEYSLLVALIVITLIAAVPPLAFQASVAREVAVDARGRTPRCRRGGAPRHGAGALALGARGRRPRRGRDDLRGLGRARDRRDDRGGARHPRGVGRAARCAPLRRLRPRAARLRGLAARRPGWGSASPAAGPLRSWAASRRRPFSPSSSRRCRSATSGPPPTARPGAGLRRSRTPPPRPGSPS